MSKFANVMIDISVKDETSHLKIVLVGLADNFGKIPDILDCYDPKSREHIISGTYPTNESCVKQISSLVNILKKYKVNVLRPKNIKGLNQIFSRDIAFVINDKLIIPNIIKDRQKEIDAIADIVNSISSNSIIKMPKGAKVEGGDVILCNDYIFVGYSNSEDFDKFKVARTNLSGVNFLRNSFPKKKIKAFQLNKSDKNPRKNSLHLDCCFQPIGKKMAIIYESGFKNQQDVDFLNNYFGKTNIIKLNEEQMYDMNANIFSISENVIISSSNFFTLNKKLRKRGFIVEEVDYHEISKMGGLLRCSTMPLLRNDF